MNAMTFGRQYFLHSKRGRGSYLHSNGCKNPSSTIHSRWIAVLRVQLLQFKLLNLLSSSFVKDQFMTTMKILSRIISNWILNSMSRASFVLEVESLNHLYPNILNIPSFCHFLAKAQDCCLNSTTVSTSTKDSASFLLTCHLKELLFLVESSFSNQFLLLVSSVAYGEENFYSRKWENYHPSVFKKDVYPFNQL